MLRLSHSELKLLLFFRPFVGHPYSYAYGRSTKALRYETLGQALDSTVSSQPNSLAVVSLHENVRMTFRELQEKVDKLAQLLVRRMFISKGDVVAIMTANTYKFVILQYACAKIGAILCPINAYYKHNELEFSLLKISPKVLFMPGPHSIQEKSINRFYEVLSKISDNLPKSLDHLVLLDGVVEERAIGRVKVFLYDEMVKELERELEKELETAKDINNNEEKTLNYSINCLNADKPCALFFTSVR